MAITDIQISEELETNAPSIKYSGNEGPKSPQEIEEQMMAGMMEDIARDFEREFGYDMGLANPEVVTEYIKVWKSRQGDTSRGPVLPNDPTKPVNPWTPKPQGPALPNRQMAAHGGIMGLDGRKKYGDGSIGSWFQKKIMDPIKENPLLAAAAAAYGLDTFGGEDGILGGRLPGGDRIVNTAISDVWGELKKKRGQQDIYTRDEKTGELIKTGKKTKGTSIIGDIGSALTDNIVPIVGGLGAGLFTKNQGGGQDASTYGQVNDQTAMDIQDYTKGLSLLNEKQAAAAGQNFMLPDKFRKYSPAEMIEIHGQEQEAANGGRIGYADGSTSDTPLMDRVKELQAEGLDLGSAIAQAIEELQSRDKKAQGGRIGRAEGGLMDLGGMEKDYRAEGGFVPIGAKEKADDVPARLSVNEFVFTADAVRNAGGGDIDKGAEVMENMMKNLEAGGQVSEESQGLGGAQQMFETSERLSEVI